MKIWRTLETKRYEIECHVTYKLSIDGTDEEIENYLTQKASENAPVHTYMDVDYITPVEVLSVTAIDEKD